LVNCEKKHEIKKGFPWWGWVFAVFFVLIVLAGIFAPEVTVDEIHLVEEESLSLGDHLGKEVNLKKEGGTATVKFLADGNAFGQKYIMKGARIDAIKTFQFLFENDQNLNEITVIVSYKFMDEYANPKNEPIWFVKMDRESAEKVNWKNLKLYGDQVFPYKSYRSGWPLVILG
jgi:hypothetical protein